MKFALSLHAVAIVATVSSATAQFTLGNSTPREITTPLLSVQSVFVAKFNPTTVGLYRTNGAIAGATLLATFPERPIGAAPSYLTGTIGTRVYFAADDGTGDGEELWMSDGSGTAMVLDIRPGSASSSPRDLARYNANSVIFTADDGVSGRELWLSDGTVLGTVRLSDAFAGAGDSNPRDLTVVGQTIYFSAFDGGGVGGTGREVWSSRGSINDAALIADVRTGPTSSLPYGFVEHGNQLLFGANDGVTGFELWSLDRTSNVASQLGDLRAGSRGSQPSQLIAALGAVYFTADDGATGVELWRSDGTPLGTQRLTDLAPGALSSAPHQLTPDAFELWFAADDATTGVELWRIDGAGTTTQVADIRTGSGSSMPQQIVRNGIGQVLFTADDGVNGREPWRASSTGASLIADLKPGPCGSRISSLSARGAVGPGPMFSAENGGLAALELYTTDGITITRLEDIRSASDDQPALDITEHLIRSGRIDTEIETCGVPPNAPVAFFISASSGPEIDIQGLLGVPSIGTLRLALPILVVTPAIIASATGEAGLTLSYPIAAPGIELTAQAVALDPINFDLKFSDNTSFCVGKLTLPSCGGSVEIRGHYGDDNFDYCLVASNNSSCEVWVQLFKVFANSTTAFLKQFPMGPGDTPIGFTVPLLPGEFIEARFYDSDPDDDNVAPFVKCRLGC